MEGTEGKVILIRHAEREDEVENISNEETQNHLIRITKRGEKQGETTGKELKNTLNTEKKVRVE